MTIEQWATHQATHQAAARQRRIAGYAAKFFAETDGAELPRPTEPTDENLAGVLAGCVRPPKPEEYDAIRQMLAHWRR